MLREFLRHLSLELNRSSLTVKAYDTDLRGFNDFLVKSGVPTDDAGFFVPSAVSRADVREWEMALADAGQSAASIRRKVQSLRAFFKFAVKCGAVSSNPAAAVTLPKTRRSLPRIATHSDIRRSIEAQPSLLPVLVIELLYGCGLRRAELLAINDADINLHSRELKVLGKGGKHRILPLPPLLVEHIVNWQRERDALYPDLPEPRPLIATRHGRMSPSSLYLMVKRALASTSAEKKSPHTLRHSFATGLLDAGVDINSVKDLLGHASLDATQIYTHVAFGTLSRDWRKAHPRSKK